MRPVRSVFKVTIKRCRSEISGSVRFRDRRASSPGNPTRGADEFWRPHWRYLETYDEYFYHPAQIRTPGGWPGHGRWNISGVGLPDGVLRKLYHENALKYLPTLRQSIRTQMTQWNSEPPTQAAR